MKQIQENNITQGIFLFLQILALELDGVVARVLLQVWLHENPNTENYCDDD